MKEQQEERILSIVEDEYTTSKRNKQEDVDDFESYIDMFDAERTEKEYDWMSDIYYPEFATRMLTQSAMDVNQYFQTRDFVESYVIETGKPAEEGAAAAQELINKTLNRKDLYHYQKFVRAKLLNTIDGRVFLKCWWEQETETEEVPVMEEGQPVTDIDGTVVTQEVERVTKDQFMYEVLDSRNVFMDELYANSLQEKDWVTIRSDTSYYKLRQERDKYGYFNLDKVKDMKGDPDTEIKNDTLDQEKETEAFYNTTSNDLTKYERNGKFWITKDGKIGIDDNGEPFETAKMKETVTTWVSDGSHTVLIGFNECPYKDSKGLHYKNIIRGLCYLHPTRDNGVGDGLYCRELEIDNNDTLNMANDRTSLATFPTFKVKRYLAEENDSFYIQPGHPIEADDPDDIQELRIDDNFQGALARSQQNKSSMDEVTAVYPTTRGATPQFASTTATAVVGADQRSDQRSNYKALTFEQTALSELYWMISQMTWQFAQPETGFKLMGDKVRGFNPEYDYYYKPVSASIESDQTRKAKMNMFSQTLQQIVNLQHPSAPKLINYILQKQLELQGDEAESIAPFLLDESQPMQPGEQAPQVEGEPVSNQNQIPQSVPEQMTRANAA